METSSNSGNCKIQAIEHPSLNPCNIIFIMGLHDSIWDGSPATPRRERNRTCKHAHFFSSRVRILPPAGFRSQGMIVKKPRCFNRLSSLGRNGREARIEDSSPRFGSARVDPRAVMMMNNPPLRGPADGPLIALRIERISYMIPVNSLWINWREARIEDFSPRFVRGG